MLLQTLFIRHIRFFSHTMATGRGICDTFLILFLFFSECVLGNIWVQMSGVFDTLSAVGFILL